MGDMHWKIFLGQGHIPGKIRIRKIRWRDGLQIGKSGVNQFTGRKITEGYEG